MEVSGQSEKRNSRYFEGIWYFFIIMALGMYKDQIYFMGSIEILKNRHNINMINLHSGKITVEDCQKLT